MVEQLRIKFILKKCQNAQMFVDVGRGAMDGAPDNFSRMSSYDTLGIVA